MWDYETKYEEAGHAIADNVALAHCIAKNTHSEYVIIAAFQQELRFDEDAELLSST